MRASRLALRHTKLPTEQLCLLLPTFIQGASTGQAAPLSQLLLTRCLFFSSLSCSLQLPAQAIQEEPQEPVETQRQSRAQTHPLDRGEKHRGGKPARERDF